MGGPPSVPTICSFLNARQLQLFFIFSAYFPQARHAKLIAVSRGRLPVCAGDRLCPAVAPSLILDMSLFADVLKHTSAGHFPEASLMLTRTRSAGSFCLDCSHRKLPPLPHRGSSSPRTTAERSPAVSTADLFRRQVSPGEPGGRSRLFAGEACQQLSPSFSRLAVPYPAASVRGLGTNPRRSQCHEQARQRGEAAFRGIQASGAACAALIRERSGRSEGFGKMPVMASLSCAGTSSL